MSDLFIDSAFPEYLEPIEKKIKKRFNFVKPLVPGKNGMTYVIQSKLNSKLYCLKTISPALNDTEERERVRETLKKEVEILEPLTHRCLPTIYEHNLRGSLPYYVSTFHPGETWESFRLNGKELQVSEAIFVIASLIDVLEYLHEEGRTHCDLHGDNILISEKVFAEGILIIDFGSGHRDSSSSPETLDRGHGGFKNLRGQQQHRRQVRRVDALQQFRDYDFTALGKALAGMQPIFFASAPHDQNIAYSEFCAMLQDGTIRAWQDAKERFEYVVDPAVLLTKAESLFVGKDGSRPHIIIPATIPVPVGDAILEVMNHPQFQRLRGIKQLSFCDWHFPGGCHTRFEHSLGVFAIARRALEMLVRDPIVKSSYEERHIKGALLAALVHDIGHYPFAHAIEHYVAGRFFDDKVKAERVRGAAYHLNHTYEILSDQEDSSIGQRIHRAWGEHVVGEAINIMRGNVGVLSQILDGPVDCDKIDYLKRDSWHCGVPYGDGFDIDEVLASFQPGLGARNLLFRKSHVHAIEGFMIAQDQMLSAVYWHEAIRGVFAMFHGFMAGTVGEDPEKIIKFIDELKGYGNENEALHSVVRPMLESTNLRGELWPLMRLHFEPNYSDIYKPIKAFWLDDPIHAKLSTTTNVYSSIVDTAKHSTKNLPIDRPKVRRLVECFRMAYEEKRAKLGRFEVLVDVPWGKNANRMVQIIDADLHEPKPITANSHLADSIFENPTAFSNPIRVFVSPRLYNEYSENSESIIWSALEKFFETTTTIDESEG